MITKHSRPDRRRQTRVGTLAILALSLVAMPAAADTLLMPKRDYLMGTSEVVWGVTTQANGTAYVLDYGDGSAQQTGNVVDRSYIAFNHTYANSGPYTVQLCVGAGAVIPACPGELASVQVNVYNAGSLNAFDLRGLNVNRAIQNGLRYLWTQQINRAANFPDGVLTNWVGSSFSSAYTGLVVLAFENHGYLLPNNNSAPTGVYERFVVQRGLNYIATRLALQSLNVQTAGDPCVGAGIEATPCTGLVTVDGDPGYATALSALPLAGSTALSRTFSGLPAGSNAGYPNGRTYREILQRITNAIAWGQNDGPAPGGGGWIYQMSNNSNQQTDGSTVGWDVLALLDAAAAGTATPAFVKTEFQTKSLPGALNNDGSFDYRGDNNAASPNSVNLAKTGIGMQGQFYVGSAPNAAQLDYVNTHWNSSAGMSFLCGNNTYNLGCGYAMFNMFKALKLHNISTIAGSTRPAGPGAIPAGDWYAEYVDWLVTNQTNPTTTTGGDWAGLYFSCCDSNAPGNAALAELILSPVALIQPDPTLFATVGLGPATAINRPGTSHTVTATATSATNTPVAGVTINFSVQTGPNTGKNGSAVTNAAGQALFTYTDTSSSPWPKVDTIQAFIGNFGSNVVQKAWVLRCDATNDNQVNNADLTVIRAANGQAASGPYDPRDGNGDGVINVVDVRYCQTKFVGPLAQ